MVGLKKKIQLIKITPYKDSEGRISTTETKYNLWANVRNVSDSRSYVSGQTRLGEGIDFTVYYRESFDLSADWQVLYLGNRFTVSSIERDEQKRFNWIIKATHVGKGHG